MNISPLGIVIIQFFEAYRDKAYRRFPHEPWTCGWGHTRGVTETTTCTSGVALQWLKEDLEEASTAARGVGIELTQHQFDALVSLAYNIGVGNFGKATELHQSLWAKRWAEVADRFLTFNHVDGVPNEGLTRRRKLEAALFLDEVA